MQYVQGMGAYIDPNNVGVLPREEMGMIMVNGRRQFVNRARRLGDPLVWETSTMHQSGWLHGSDAPQTLSLEKS